MINFITGAMIGTGISALLGIPPKACLVSLGLMAFVAVLLDVAGVWGK